MPRLLSLLLLALLLTGCSLGRSPTTDYYMLPSVADVTPTDTSLSGPRVGVGPLTLPGYLDRNAILLRKGDASRVTINEQAEWSESLSEGITRVLCESLSRKLSPVQGMAFPIRAAVPFTWRVSVDMARFDGAPDGNVQLECGWTLSNQNGDVLAMGRFADSAPAGPDLSTYAQAQSALLDRLGASLAREILRVGK